MKQRVKLPARSKELLDLAKKVQLKHVADGPSSPLNALDWQVAGPLIEKVVAAHERAEELRREMRRVFQERNLNLRAVRDVVRGCRDVLTGRYIREMKALGQWGFDVMDVRATPVQEPVEDAKPSS
jgi:hypothetical protein